MAVQKKTPKVNVVKAYVCDTNWIHDFPGTGELDGVYLKLADLKKGCANRKKNKYYCGILELEIKVRRVIQKGSI